MQSIAFPNMFSNSRVKTVQDKEATYQNLRLALLSDNNSLFGDPYFGNTLRYTIYSQNDAILKDLVIDKIYDCIQKFIPQVVVNRNDIDIVQQDDRMYASIKATNLLDYETDLYEIFLTQTENF